jgi:hypothetical protein
MRAKQQRLLDISRPRGASDEVERARRAAFAIDAPHLGEHALVIGFDRLARQDDDMIVGQKIERCRIVRAGNERQRSGFGDPGEGRRDGVEVVPVGRAAQDFERGLAPWHSGKTRIVAHAQRRRTIAFA